jgi:hypothetical protein
MDEVLNAARRQVVFGILWCLGGVGALFYAFGSTGSGWLWYGAFIGSAVHWYRALSVYGVALRSGWRAIRGSDLFAVAAAVALVVGSVRLLVPEYDRISNPQVGTCWSEEVGSEYLTVVACWSDQADFVAVREASSPTSCRAVYVDVEGGVLCLERND